MNPTAKKLLTNWRVLLLLLFLVFSFVAMKPQLFGAEGVIIKSVVQNSSAANAGIVNPASGLAPLAKERILAINGQKVSSPSDYYLLVSALPGNTTIRVETNKQMYTLLTPLSSNESVNLGMRIGEAPSSNIRKGLDLEGGTRVLLKPAEEVSAEDFESIIENLKERLNVYGLSDVTVRSSSDLSGQNFILIEIAGVTEEEVKDLLARQGKFEAQIANETVFFGGKKDITYVCRTAQCSGIDPQRGCSPFEGGYGCSFFFQISLSPEAAERQAGITKNLQVVTEGSQRYLSESLILYLDDKEVDSLRIGAELQGRATTDIQITGSGTGRTQQEGIQNTLQQMKRLQTILITGSLPVKLDIVKMDTISPSLGKEFLENVVLVGVLAVLSVVVIVLIRYRTPRVVLPMVFTFLSEMVMILGFAALVGWNLDLAAIAGIIIAAGTGVDHLIIITDETLHGKVVADWKLRIKNAMFIVMGAYFTNLSGMVPLWFAGAGLLKGFAFTTIVGLSFGVLIARPAYAAIVEILVHK